MSTLIDGSSLLAVHPTGVSFAVRELLSQHLLPIETDATIGTVRTRSAAHPLPDAGYAHLHRSLPSRAVHAYCRAGGSLASLFPGTWTRLFLPNINIVGIPRLPYDLLVHDLSFLIHPPWFPGKTRLWHHLAQPKQLITQAERLFAVSPQTKRALVELLAIPEHRITLVPLHTQKTLPTTLPRPIPDPYFLLLAANDPRKNSACAERAFLAFAKDHPEWKLVLVGHQKLSAHPNILTLPYLTNEARIQWMQHAAALLYPSWYEGYGLPMQEAHDLNIPVLASSTTTVAETAPTGTVLIPPFSPTLWAEGLRGVALTRPDLRMDR